MADMRTAILRAAQAADRLHKEFDTKTCTDGDEGRGNVFSMMAHLTAVASMQAAQPNRAAGAPTVARRCPEQVNCRQNQ